MAELSNVSAPAIDAITAEDERAFGESASIVLIASHGGLVLDEPLSTYVNEVGNLVASQGSRRILRKDGTPRTTSRRVSVGILDEATPSAWSFPGGYIFVTRGLLELLQSESELAWILGREIAHIDEEHGLKALKLRVASSAFLTGGAVEMKDSVLLAKVADEVLRSSVRQGMQRNDEREADLLGLEYAVKAGYDAAGAQRVLALLASLSAAAPRRLFSPHDSPEQRFQTLAAKIEAAPGGAMGAERFDTTCLRRLEAYALTKKADAGATPAP